MAAMCCRCAKKLKHLRIPWNSTLRSICAAPSNSLAHEVDNNHLSGIEASFVKKRDPMAVLKALASTVKPVPNLPNPEFIEDLVLLPRSKAKQEACLAAKQSGCEAAAFVISRCPGSFPLREPNPVWISGLAKAADSKSEKDLKYFIQANDAKNAILAFERLKEQGIEVSLDSQNDLLDLAAQHLGNIPAKQVLAFGEVTLGSIESEGKKMESLEEDLLSDSELDEDRDLGISGQERSNGTITEDGDKNPGTSEWRNDNYAMEMFDSMETKNGKTYEVMVLGFLKYRSYKDAYNLFREMRQLGFQASLFTYNLLLRAISKSRQFDFKWDRAKELIQSMGEEPVVLPDLKTYNTLMKVAVVSPETDNMSKTDLALGILRDMMAAGLEPTLESYNQLIRAEYVKHWEKKKQIRESNDYRMKAKEAVSPMILNKVITHLESLPKLPPLRDPDDAFFFRSAMSAALLCLDSKLAIRVYKLVEKEDNIRYLGDKHGLFYSAFLLALTSTDTDFSVIYDYYKEIVPHRFRPKEHIYTSLFNLAHRTNNPGIVKRFYDDMRKYRVQLTMQVATALFRAMGGAKDPKHIEANVPLMLDVLRWMKMYRVEITHVHITQLIRMLCRNNQLEDAWQALNMFAKNKVPIPTYTALNDILVKASQEKDEDKVKAIFEMMAKYGYNLNRKRRLALYDSTKIPTVERRRIDELFSDMSVLGFMQDDVMLKNSPPSLVCTKLFTSLGHAILFARGFLYKFAPLGFSSS
ncbi:small ribosomal subunit protein mS39-like isoform X1 [Montipora capricornis]|uniref:small ribosomal subunit protein mS39-like isoform X1 n=1 Tax=Montipora capricornis TaxID=246305 RepID=UPI0035F1EC62